MRSFADVDDIEYGERKGGRRDYKYEKNEKKTSERKENVVVKSQRGE